MVRTAHQRYLLLSLPSWPAFLPLLPGRPSCWPVALGGPPAALASASAGVPRRTRCARWRVGLVGASRRAGCFRCRDGCSPWCALGAGRLWPAVPFAWCWCGAPRWPFARSRVGGSCLVALPGFCCPPSCLSVPAGVVRTQRAPGGAPRSGPPRAPPARALCSPPWAPRPPPRAAGRRVPRVLPPPRPPPPVPCALFPFPPPPGRGPPGPRPPAPAPPPPPPPPPPAGPMGGPPPPAPLFFSSFPPPPPRCVPPRSPAPSYCDPGDFR